MPTARAIVTGMSGIAPNPFTPGRGVPPPFLAGRESQLAEADALLDRLAEGRMPAQDLLLYGPRGNGKTTLLLEIGRRAQERRFRVERLPVEALTDREGLLRLLLFRAGGLTLGERTAAVPTPIASDLLMAWVGADSRPLLIVLDEAQALEPEAARPFFDAVRDAKSGPAPFLVVAAGTPGAPRRLRQAATHNERGFALVPVGRFARSETKAALTEPANATGLPMAEEAAALLADESRDYPYFAQLLGQAGWDAAAGANSPEIGLSAARQGAAECAGSIDDLYEGRYDEARSRRISPVLRPLGRLFTEHRDELPDAALDEFVHRFAEEDSIPFAAPALRQELTDLGVVWADRPGSWEPGLAGFLDYLSDRP